MTFLDKTSPNGLRAQKYGCQINKCGVSIFHISKRLRKPRSNEMILLYGWTRSYIGSTFLSLKRFRNHGTRKLVVFLQGSLRLSGRARWGFSNRKSYGPIRCGFKSSRKFLRCSLVRFLNIVNATHGAVRFWYNFEKYPAVRCGLKMGKPNGAVRCGFQKP